MKHLFHCKLFFFTARFCASLQSFGFFTAKSFCSAANFWHFKKGFRLFHCKVSVFSLQGFLVPLQSLQWNQPLCQFLPTASLFLPKASPSISAESVSVYFCREPLLSFLPKACPSKSGSLQRTTLPPSARGALSRSDPDARSSG